MSRAQRKQFGKLLMRIFRSAAKDRKFVMTIAMQVSEDAKILKSPITPIADYIWKQFKLIHAEGSRAQDFCLLVENFLKSYRIELCGKIHKELTEFVEKIFSSDQEDKELVVNIWHHESRTYDCHCERVGMENRNDELCYSCGKKYHPNCAWPRQKNEQYFQCAACFLTRCLPNRPVSQVVFAGYLRSKARQSLNFRVNYVIKHLAREEEVVLRCARLSKEDRYEITFPKSCSIFKSQSKIADFQPLPPTSPRKKRLDDEVYLTNYTSSSLQSLRIEVKKVPASERIVQQDIYLIMMLKVRTLNVLALERRMLNSRKGITESRQILKAYLNNTSNQCSIEKLHIFMKCPLYQNSIVNPARSRHCTTHFQPFDLRNFITASHGLRESTQRWKCPICRKRAYDIEVDEYILSLIQSSCNLKEIAFSSTGEPILYERDASEIDIEDIDDKQGKQQTNQAKGIYEDVISINSDQVLTENNDNFNQALVSKDPFEFKQSTPNACPAKRNRAVQEFENINGRKKARLESPEQIQPPFNSNNPKISKDLPNICLSKTIQVKMRSPPIQPLSNKEANAQTQIPIIRKDITKTISLATQDETTQKRKNQILAELEEIIRESSSGHILSSKQQLIFNKLCRGLLNINLC